MVLVIGPGPWPDNETPVYLFYNSFKGFVKRKHHNFYVIWERLNYKKHVCFRQNYDFISYYIYAFTLSIYKKIIFNHFTKLVPQYHIYHYPHTYQWKCLEF